MRRGVKGGEGRKKGKERREMEVKLKSRIRIK